MQKKKYELWEWLDFWREVYYKPTVSAGTFEISYYNVQIIKKFFPNQTLKKVDAVSCQLFLNKMYDEGYAKATIKKCNSFLHKAFQWAVTANYMVKNPMENLIIPQAPTKKVMALTQKEQIVIETYCKNTFYGDFVLFLFYTGLRVGEMINLEWSDFNKEERTISIKKSKTAAGVRVVPLIDDAFAIILKQQKMLDDNKIFHNKRGAPITYEVMKKVARQLRKESGFTGFTSHVCRHSFATRLIEKGAKPKSVAALLGHNKVEYSLNIYTDMEATALKNDIYLLQETAIPTENTDIMQCISFINEKFNGKLPEELKSLFK